MIAELELRLKDRFSAILTHCVVDREEITVEVSRENSFEMALALRDEPDFQFNQLMDLCGVDYLKYGVGDWETESTTYTGFERGVELGVERPLTWSKPRFAVVCHLLSTLLNHRLRVRVLLEENDLKMPSLIEIWPSANWFEREAFDLFGIQFDGHPDLRRILTDYGFRGHPFRKDFPLSGHVEMRYDAEKKRVIYEPINLQERILTPKVIRAKSEEPLS